MHGARKKIRKTGRKTKTIPLRQILVLPSLAPSTDNPWNAVSTPEIGDIPAVLSVS